MIGTSDDREPGSDGDARGGRVALLPLPLPSSCAVVAIVGPTASGKSAVAELLAAALPGEVISADSMQVYRGMDIGTAKPPGSTRRVTYHCLDVVEPGEAYSAARFQQDARAAITQVQDRGRWPVVVGGTGLYVRAALDAMEFPRGDVDSSARGRYQALAREQGAAGVHALLAERDPASARLIHPNNTRRTVRALEMLDGGVSYAHQASGFGTRTSVWDTLFIGLDMDRRALYERIDRRVDEMLDSGLLDEVRALLAAGYRDAVTATQAIGYKELVPVLEEGADPGEAAAAIKQATRRYAKRQLTWFRADERVRWIDVTRLDSAAAAAAAYQLVESFARRADPSSVAHGTGEA